jgi:hypothetical protein
MRLTGLAALASGHPAAATVIAAAFLAAMFMAWRAARRITAGVRSALRGHQAEDLLTVLAAGMATAVAANGMWRFAGTVLHFSGAERATLFAFLEVSVVTCAFRARRNMRSFGSAGAEGIAVWVLSGLSAVFSAIDARSGAEAVFRLAPPLVASWLWHRAMALEHRRSSGRVIHWRLTAERVLVWLGVAEPSARAAGDVDAHRRITRLARAAKQLRELRAAGARPRRQERARRRLDRAMEAAVEHAGLASDPARQDQMRDQIAALNAAGGLADLTAEAPWDRRAAGTARDSEMQELAARAETAERDLQAARIRARELAEALARAESRADERAVDVDRDALVAELAAGIRAAARDGEKWRPDYDDLMERTGRQRRWCEYLVSEARSAVFGTAGDGPAPSPAQDPARAGSAAEPGLLAVTAGQLAAVNGRHPQDAGESLRN